MRTKRLTENEINFNVYNALNLYSEELGEEYLNNHFNPFETGFELTEDFIIDRFVNQNNSPLELNAPEFISSSTTETKIAFENSIKNCTEMLNQIEIMLQDPNLPEKQKEELKKLKTYLLCRIQLLTAYNKKLKKDKNTFKMYQNIQGLDWKISELFDETYKQMFNVNMAISAYLNMKNAYKGKSSLENKALREKAQAIIRANQQKMQEMANETNNKQTKDNTAKTNKISTKSTLNSKVQNKNKENMNKTKTEIERNI